MIGVHPNGGGGDPAPIMPAGAVVFDRLALLSAFALFGLLSGRPMATAFIVIAVQALLAVAYNGRKLWRGKKKVSPKQMISAGIAAIAVIIQIILILSAIGNLGVFRAVITFIFAEYFIVFTPILGYIRNIFPLSQSPPMIPTKISPFRRKVALCLISAAFLIIGLSPIESKPTDEKSSILNVYSAFQGLMFLIVGSAIGVANRRFLSAGVRTTGFSSLNRFYGFSLCFAFFIMIPLMLIRAGFYRDHSSPSSSHGFAPILYLISAISWFVYNTPTRDRPPISQSLLGLFILSSFSLLLRFFSLDESIISLSNGIIIVLIASAILCLNSTFASINFRFSISSEFRAIFRHILERQTTRRIFIFLCINFAFTFIEIGYGYWNNSLGLISDAVHMLFDCIALGIGLYASYVARLKANDEFPYGYGRFEVVSGFVNGIFLVLISFSVFVESIERLFYPPDIEGFEILVVAVLGLLVNMIGLVFFREAHSHSHGGGACEGHNSNMQGIYLHVLADALGSVGVIISSLLVHFFNLTIADPICSLVIAGLILGSVYHLLKETSLILLLRSPPNFNHSVLNEICSSKGVVGCRDFAVWSFRSTTIISSLSIHVEANADSQDVLSKIKGILRKMGIERTTIQMENDEFVARLEPEIRTRYHRFDPTLQKALDDGHGHSHCSGGHGHSHG